MNMTTLRLSVLIWTLLVCFVPVHGQGVAFADITLAQALDKAAQEDKLIFVDAYTTWCGPCKWMSKEVFPDEEVGAYYNATFVNLKLDMEKGEGIDFAKKYEVTAFPTLLFLNSKGEKVHLSLGARPAEDFLDLGRAAVDPDRQVLSLQARYDAGERSADFLKKYVDALTSAGMDGFDEAAQTYMDMQEDWTTEENMKFILMYAAPTIDSKLFRYTLEHRDAFVELFGKEEVYNKLEWASESDRSAAGIARDDVEKMTAHFAKYFGNTEARDRAMMTYLRPLMYSPDPVKQEQFLTEVVLFLADEPDLGWEFYNATAWQVFEITEDPELLKKASTWATLSMDAQRNSYNTDTKAWILYKLGKNKEARIYAEESVLLAKSEGADPAETLKLIEKLDSKN